LYFIGYESNISIQKINPVILEAFSPILSEASSIRFKKKNPAYFYLKG